MQSPPKINHGPGSACGAPFRRLPGYPLNIEENPSSDIEEFRYLCLVHVTDDMLTRCGCIEEACRKMDRGRDLSRDPNLYIFRSYLRIILEGGGSKALPNQSK